MADVRVLLIGSTGVLGRATGPALLAAGHEVTGLARDAGRVAAVRAAGATPVVADLFDVPAMTRVLRGHDAVINLATRVPVGGKLMRASSWAETVHLRAEGSRALVEAARAADIGILVQEGTSLLYADGGEAELDEHSRLDPLGPTAAAEAAHAEVAAFTRDGRVGVRLRIANVHGDDPLTRWVLQGARRGGPAYFGSPDGWITPIHPSDVGTAAVAALDAPSGVYNVGATPLRKREFGETIAEAVTRPRVRRLPRALSRGFVAHLARSQRVVSHELTEATGWKPARPVLTAAWFPKP